MTSYNERLDKIIDRVYLFGMNGCWVNKGLYEQND